MIVEVNPSGHRLVYVQCLVEEARRRGSRVLLGVTRKVHEDHRFKIHLEKLLGDLTILYVRPEVSLHELQQVALNAHIDLIVVPDALPFGRRLLFGAREISPKVRLLVMNDPRWALEGRGGLRIRKRLTKIFLWLATRRRGQELYWLRHQGDAAIDKFSVVDPFIMDGSVDEIRARAGEMRLQLGLTDDTLFWFGVIGSIDHHKNVPMILDALDAVAEQSGRGIGFALIGEWATGAVPECVSEAIARSQVRCVEYRHQMTNEEMNSALAALDCVVIAYSTNQPNSTMVKAAALGVRCAVAGSASIRRFSKDVTGREGVPLQLDPLIEEMAVALLRPQPSPRTMRGPEALTHPLLEGLGEVG